MMGKTAAISDCGNYRFELTRSFDSGRGICVWIMLNPSTADAEIDDPTIRRCMRFTQDFGYRRMVVINLYAYRSKDPCDLKRVRNPVGKGNDRYLEQWIATADRVVVAWGGSVRCDDRADAVRQIAYENHTKLWCLGKTKNGAPRHPLYVRASQELVPWR